jgi:hypothetical protein
MTTRVFRLHRVQWQSVDFFTLSKTGMNAFSSTLPEHAPGENGKPQNDR